MAVSSLIQLQLFVQVSVSADHQPNVWQLLAMDGNFSQGNYYF